MRAQYLDNYGKNFTLHTHSGILMKPMKPLDMTVSETLDRKPFFVTEKKRNIYVKPFSQDKLL